MLATGSALIFAAFVGSGWYEWGWIDYGIVAVAGAIVVIHLARMKLKEGRGEDVLPQGQEGHTWKRRRSRKRKK